MSAGYLTTFEHRTLDVRSVGTETAIDGHEAASLDALSERLAVPFSERKYRSVRLANYCGIVTIGARLLEVLPKIDDSGGPAECRGVLLNLLRRSAGPSVFRDLPAPQQLREAPLIEAFITSFLESVSAIVRGGLLRQYREQEDDLRLIRGRIVAPRQFGALASRKDIVSCRFDELTADHEWNRFIKAGLRAVRPWMISMVLRHRWMDLITVFDEVSDVEARASDFARLPRDRKTARYLLAGEWARRILAVESPSLRAGAENAPGLLFDINALWEQVVAAEIGRLAAQHGLRVETQVTGWHLATLAGGTRPALGLRPDLVISHGERVVAILDTKWKRLEVGRGGYLKPSPEDVYQMHAYAATFRCERLALVYPSHRGLNGASDTVFELPAFSGTKPRVAMICIEVEDGAFAPRCGASELRQFLDPQVE